MPKFNNFTKSLLAQLILSLMPLIIKKLVKEDDSDTPSKDELVTIFREGMTQEESENLSR